MQLSCLAERRKRVDTNNAWPGEAWEGSRVALVRSTQRVGEVFRDFHVKDLRMRLPLTGRLPVVVRPSETSFTVLVGRADGHDTHKSRRSVLGRGSVTRLPVFGKPLQIRLKESATD